MSEKKNLKELEEKMLADKSLPLNEGTLVFGEGNPKADVLFIGEAPGFYEDREGRPFVGRAGKLLDKLLEETGSKREDCYITNVVKRRPPKNRDPLPEEIKAYKPYLEKQIEIISPKVIVPLGRYAMNHFLDDGKISQDQGKIFWWRNILLIPLYHPAAALRRASLIEDIKNGLTKLPKLISGYEDLLKKRLEKKKLPNEE
ncbi:uracil-DNA glycosylase [Patescibacteria group bacterium]|nr:uracil-DNA glycosylase [Patescibacteria group bacterium]